MTPTQTAFAERERLYKAARKDPELVQIPEMSFAMVDGHGDPNTSADYGRAIQLLYSVSYVLKFALKRDGAPDYRVSPLEGLWWAEDMAQFSVERRSDWRWTMMIAQPEAVTAERFTWAVAEAARKKDLPESGRVRLDRLAEGWCAQILHVGPYSAEGPTIERLHAFIAGHGLRFDGRTQKHHEIYLGDPRRSAPERLRTILRQPVVIP